ncbi:MAG: porin [Flavobacteriaceae bacterium]|nr:porin [Flavobacteriaceae bacterium]
MKKLIFVSLSFCASYLSAQITSEEINKNTIDSLKMEVQNLKDMMVQKQQEKEKPKDKKWYDKISLSGYIQMRYEDLETNSNLRCEQCDHFWGDERNGLSFRRIRFKFSGQITPRIFFYLQPDFAKSVGSTNFLGAIKDAYFDIGLNATNEYKLRLGQSKVPFGYENLQSSSVRLPLDRDDALNSGLKDERDLGIFFMWTGKKQKEMMKQLKELKHSGDFGIFAFGFYNGQTGNNFDKNKKFHWVTRFSYPFKVGNQILETGIQAYTGKFVLPKLSKGTLTNSNKEYTDQRLAASFVLYPQPFGIQAEYNIGKGPAFDEKTNSVEEKTLNGGYITLSYFINQWNQTFIPFTRIQHYKGGKKHELDARNYDIQEYEFGVEWHPFKSFELVTMYTYSNRKYQDLATPNYHEKGGVLRLQAQLKF